MRKSSRVRLSAQRITTTLPGKGPGQPVVGADLAVERERGRTGAVVGRGSRRDAHVPKQVVGNGRDIVRGSDDGVRVFRKGGAAVGYAFGRKLAWFFFFVNGWNAPFEADER